MAAAGPQKLLCVGDSHTEAIAGTDWVGALAAATSGKLRVVREGRGGQWAVLIRRRLEGLIDAHPDARGVVILAGTNDVIASLGGAKLALYRAVFPALGGARADLDAYKAEVEAMLAALRARLPGCRAAVVTLPPVGEDLSDEANKRVVQYNAALRALVARHSDGARLIDLHSACARRLEERRAAAAAAGQAAAPPPPGLPGMPLWRMVGLQLWAAAQRYVLRRPWDAIADGNGLHLLTDHVHLSDRTGGLLLQELRPFVDELLVG